MANQKRIYLAEQLAKATPIGVWPFRRVSKGRGIFRAIKTKRCVLRLASLRDAQEFAAAAGAPCVAEWMLNFPSPFPAGLVQERIKSSWTGAVAGKSLSLVAIHRDTGTLMGGVALNNIRALPEPELAYWVRQSAWRQGYGLEITSALIDHAFTTRGDTRLRASVLPGNTASLRLLDVLGFVADGVEMVWAEPYAKSIDWTLEEVQAQARNTGSPLVSISLNRWTLTKHRWANISKTRPELA